MIRRVLGVFSLAALLALAGGARASSPPVQGAEPSSPDDLAPPSLSDVDPSNGIDAREASAIAWAYFEQEYGDCGAPYDGVLHRKTWVFRIAFGVTGETLKETIKVDAKTGGVWSQGGPRHRDLESFRKAVSVRKQAPQAKLGAVQQGVAADGAPRRR